MGMWTMALVSFITASLTLQAALKNGFIYEYSDEIVVKTPTLYNCNYAGMWCSCYSNHQGGCDLSCDPNIYKVLHNQTSCPEIPNLILAGFTVN